MNKNIIELNNVSKEFNGKKVVDNVNLNIKKGSITGIIGRNGSGKTVLLKMICGLYFPSSGEVKLNDVCVSDDVGVLIDSGFLDNETGFDNLLILSKLKNIISSNDIIDIMKFVKLDPYLKTKYKNYSTGMKQKLRLAQALMEKPKVLILDEPFNGMDKESVNYLRGKLLELKDENITIIITSHYQEDIDKLCDIVYEMDFGKIELKQ